MHRDLLGGENMADIGACKVLGIGRPKYLVTGPLPTPKPPPDDVKTVAKEPSPRGRDEGKENDDIIKLTHANLP